MKWYFCFRVEDAEVEIDQVNLAQLNILVESGAGFRTRIDCEYLISPLKLKTFNKRFEEI